VPKVTGENAYDFGREYISEVFGSFLVRTWLLSAFNERGGKAQDRGDRFQTTTK
jgi:hypothetical protein